MQIVMIQDKILPAEEADSMYFDRGLYFGDGVYEVLRSYNGKIFALDEHMQRFSRSLSAIEINSVDIKDIRAKVIKAFEAAKIADAKIYFHITRGSAIRSHTWQNDIKPNFFLHISQLDDDKELKSKGVTVSTHPDWRWKRCDIKSLNLLANVLARQDAAKKGCYEAILVDDKGFITEGAGSAFFEIFGRKLQTAPLTSNILPSVTRKFIIRAVENIGLDVIEKQVTVQQAMEADELFLAISTRDIVPVVRFDNKIIGSGKPGRYTGQLIEEFKTFTR